MPSALFLVDNVPLELDSRVRRQTGTLRDAGFDVSVICPGDEGSRRHEVVNGIHVYRYRKPSVEGMKGHLLEYVVMLAAQTALVSRVFARRRFDVIHLANPPDLLWIVAIPFKILFGTRIVYDQHDLVPELFEVRYGDRSRALKALVGWTERMSFRTADHVISTNETFKRIAIARGGVDEDRVTIVRNGPRLTIDFVDVQPDAGVRSLAPVIVGYLGIMNQQDHLDVFLEMARIIRFDRGRQDIAFVMVGDGDDFGHLDHMRERLGLAETVHMTGRVPWRTVIATISATDICVQPDPPTIFNDKLTMNKLMEYMAFGKPFVAFDMVETRRSGRDGGVYVDRFDAVGLADAVIELGDDPGRRAILGANGRRIIENELAWEHQSQHLLEVYEAVLGQGRHVAPAAK